METIIMIACGCLGQACCWYRVFSCCGCIEDGNPHVQVERQQQPTTPTNPTPTATPYTPSPNPFLTGALKDAYPQSAYKI